MLLATKTWRARREGKESAKEPVELLDCAGPAVAVTIARLLVEELLVGQRQQRAVAIRRDLDRHQGFALRRRFPGPGEDEFLVGHELAIDTADVVLFAARALHQPAIAAADARFALGLKHFDFAGAHPAFYFFRIGP